MLNIVWCLAAVGTDVKFSILNDSALIGAKESTMSGSRWARGMRSFLVSSFSEEDLVVEV